MSDNTCAIQINVPALRLAVFNVGEVVGIGTVQQCLLFSINIYSFEILIFVSITIYVLSTYGCMSKTETK